MNAIILDGQLKSALSAVRSLGRHGIFVSVGAVRESGMALHSKYARTRFTYPSPYSNQDAFIRAVKAEAVRMGGKPVAYAFSDATYLSLYAHRNELAGYATLIFPYEKSVEIAFDKAATYSIARVSGVPTISTYMPENKEEVVLLSKTLAYPAVLKSRKSVSWNHGKGVFGSAIFVQTPKELIEQFLIQKNLCGESPLVQDLVVGEEYGVEMLAHEGRVGALVVHHRLRSLSPTGGASVLKETVFEGELKSILIEYSEKLVHRLTWSGPIMVEWKVESDSRQPLLMEINGRFWGSLPLSVASGVDVPYLFYELATTGSFPKVPVIARDGVVTRHFLGDVRHLIRTFFSRDNMRSLLYPSRLKALRDFFVLPRGTQSDVWSWRDPAPALFELFDYFKKFFHQK